MFLMLLISYTMHEPMNKIQKIIFAQKKPIEPPKTRTPTAHTLTCLGSSGNGSGGGSGHHILLANGGLDTHTLLGEQVDQQRAGTAVTLGVEASLVVLVLQHRVQVDIEEVG